MRRATAAPSFWGLAFSCSVSERGACRDIPADPNETNSGNSLGKLPIFGFGNLGHFPKNWVEIFLS